MLERSFAPEDYRQPQFAPTTSCAQCTGESDPHASLAGQYGGHHLTLKRDPLPIHRVLDIGCGAGGLRWRSRKKLRADVIGVELRAPSPNLTTITIVEANAVRSALPIPMSPWPCAWRTT